MKIVVFGNMDLPQGSAGATRCVAFCHLAAECGYEPILLGVNYSGSKTITGVFENIKFELLDFDELKYTGRRALLRKAILKREVVNWLSVNCKHSDTKCIITYGVKRELSWLLKYSSKHQIPIIKDVVEWYDINNFQGITGLFNLIEDRIGLHYWNKKCKNIIAISSLFEHFYNDKGCHTIRIPTILDTNRFSCIHESSSEQSKLIISYAGSPMKKDYISNAVQALLLLNNEERKDIQLHLYGVTWEYLTKNGLNKSDKKVLGDSLICHGRVSHEAVKVGLQKSDFTVLLRPNERYANAGFPTKLGESMATGIPVIANLTSDIGLYLHDGIEGFVCADETPNSCATTFRRVLATSVGQRIEMKSAARKQSEKSFDYRIHKEQFNQFLLNLR